jgi:membrane fusion protein, heavy metal efflux system
MIRVLFLLGGIALGLVAAVAAPGFPSNLRGAIASLPGLGWSPARPAPAVSAARRPDHDEGQSEVRLTEEQIAAAGIMIAEAGPGQLQRHLQVPGAIVPSGDRIAHVAVKLLGTVAELRKRLGDSVQGGEVVAVIESRDVADAKSEYLAARLTYDLQQTLAERAKRLSDVKGLAENEYLRIRGSFEDARVKRDTARQKLLALGMTDLQIADLSQGPVGSLERQELRAPISGKVVERRVDLGALVGREGLESELFVIVDLSEVWVDLAIPPSTLSQIHEGQDVVVPASENNEIGQARIMFVSPLLDKDTRSARVIALLPNPHEAWRPGLFVTAQIALTGAPAAVLVPENALQTVKGEAVVFVRTAEGFDVRSVKPGRKDGRSVEIVAGLSAGEIIAITNTYTLKAELGKVESGHDD